jgi:hypothetical protein
MMQVFDATLVSFDHARRRALLSAIDLPWVGALLRSKQRRIALLGSLNVALSLALSCTAPGLLLVLGPALFGVFHVASDVRYLVLRQNYPRPWIASLAVGSAALVCLRILAFWCKPLAGAENAVGGVLVLAGLWMGASASSLRKARSFAALATVPLGVLTMLATACPLPAQALFAYAHNFVSFAAWLLLGIKTRWALVPLGLVGLGLAVIFAGAPLVWLRLDAPWTVRLIEEAHRVLPTWPGRTRLLFAASYVFAQAVHYSVWLTWIPQAQVRGEAMLTCRMSVRAARRDLGRTGLTVVISCALAVALLSIVAVHRVRAMYLTIAAFHGYLELACLAFLLARASSFAQAPACEAAERPS